MPPETSAQEQPLVSIICRSIGRAELAQALQSVSAQTYPNIEIVLVDAIGKGLGDVSAYCGTRRLVPIADGQPRKRAAAANAGLDVATGEYLLLLDDDDWIAPTHIANLLQCLQNETEIKAAYSNTQKTDISGSATEHVFNTAFDPVLLMRDNYIPIHAMLFHRDLLQHCRFDEAFDIYEDWDFWLQLNEHTSFAHMDTITAFYREGGESETAATETSLRYRNDTLLGRGRAAIFSKWMPRWNGARMNALIGSLDQSQELQSRAQQLHEVRVSLDDSRRALDNAITVQHSLRSTNDVLQGDIERFKLQLHHDELRIQELQKHAANQEQHIIELTSALHRIHHSTSWKLMGPFRRVYRHLQALAGGKKP